MEEVVKKKVLILGSYGMIGHQIFYELYKSKKYELYNSSKNNKLNEKTVLLDLTDFQSTQDLITELKPNFIVNCAGILIEDAEKKSSEAILLNAYLPHFLEHLCNLNDIKLIQISTDCVFSGKNPPYFEYSKKEGTSVYSKTKSLGEINSKNHLTIRTSVIGPDLKIHGKELFSWFMSQSGTIEGYEKAIWSGVSTLELAKTIDLFIQKEITGIYNLCSKEPISKLSLLRLMAGERRDDIEIIPVQGTITNKTLIDSRKELGYVVPSYKTMISDIFSLVNVAENYKHYRDE